MTMTEPDAPMTLPRTERPDAPAYLQKYLDRESRGSRPGVATPARPEEETPLYLRRFRDRRSGGTSLDAPVPLWEGADVGATRAWAEVTRTKEIVPERKDQTKAAVTDVYFVRHGETQGYSTESGLTPLGSWHAHRRGK